jgi:hypothetical protein
MTKLDLTQYRNRMFADRGTDINDALEYASSLNYGNPEGLTAMYVLLNTVINAVQADSLASAALSAAAPEPERIPTAVIISAAVRDWLADNASEMVSDWMDANAGDMVADWCGDNHDVEEWLNENAGMTIEHWMNYNAQPKMGEAIEEALEELDLGNKIEEVIGNLDLSEHMESAINDMDLVVRAR